MEFSSAFSSSLSHSFNLSFLNKTSPFPSIDTTLFFMDCLFPTSTIAFPRTYLSHSFSCVIPVCGLIYAWLCATSTTLSFDSEMDVKCHVMLCYIMLRTEVFRQSCMPTNG